MFARRALAQSLAREFGPRGVHVAHAVVDGVIDIPRTQSYTNVNGGAEDGKISADAVGFSSFSFSSSSPFLCPLLFPSLFSILFPFTLPTNPQPSFFPFLQFPRALPPTNHILFARATDRRELLAPPHAAPLRVHAGDRHQALRREVLSVRSSVDAGTGPGEVGSARWGGLARAIARDMSSSYRGVKEKAPGVSCRGWRGARRTWSRVSAWIYHAGGLIRSGTALSMVVEDR